jgi:Methylase involved in ubiquinone/menaquinone biosynthesis
MINITHYRHTPFKLSKRIPFIFRTFSSSSGEQLPTNLAFDRNLKTLQRSNISHHKSYDYFRKEIASRLVDRLDDIIRDEGFPLALDIGSGPGYLYREIVKDDGFDGQGGIGGVRKLVMLDSCHDMLHRDDEEHQTLSAEEKARCGTYKLVGEEEGPLPFPDGTFDLVMSSSAMHWVNNLPGLWSEVKRVLKPDGCFMFAMVGGGTLNELRSSLVLAELERDGGVGPHVGPFVDFADVGSILTNAGFNLTTIDIDTIKLGFPNAMVCMEHLQRMGESNACLNRRPSMSVDTFLASACMYDEMYPLDDGDDSEKSVEATIQVIYGIGWKPHDSQPKPKERGSATRKIGDVVVERSTREE